MRILLDECIDQDFRSSFQDHDCQSARYAGFGGLRNGELLAAAEAAKFDVFLTVDKSIEYQQNLKHRKNRSDRSLGRIDSFARFGAARIRMPCRPGVDSAGPTRQNRRLAAVLGIVGWTGEAS